jgi:hypothetical protein
MIICFAGLPKYARIFKLALIAAAFGNPPRLVMNRTASPAGIRRATLQFDLPNANRDARLMGPIAQFMNERVTTSGFVPL